LQFHALLQSVLATRYAQILYSSKFAGLNFGATLTFQDVKVAAADLLVALPELLEHPDRRFRRAPLVNIRPRNPMTEA
jgi:hypothetical protein